jgi:hypothetical protein
VLDSPLIEDIYVILKLEIKSRRARKLEFALRQIPGRVGLIRAKIVAGEGQDMQDLQVLSVSDQRSAQKP